MRPLRLVFLFLSLILATSCNLLPGKDTAKESEASKEPEAVEAGTTATWSEGTYKWEENGNIMGTLDISDPSGASFAFSLFAYDGQDVGELAGTTSGDDEAVFTHPDNEECTVTFTKEKEAISVQATEECQNIADANVSFDGTYTFIQIGSETHADSESTDESTTEESATEEESDSEADAESAKEEPEDESISNWKEALYIDARFDKGNLSIYNVTPDSFMFSFDVSSGGHVGNLTGKAKANGNEAIFQDNDQPECKGTFTMKDNVITFEEDSCLYYHGAAVEFSGEFTMTDDPPNLPTATRENNSCSSAPFHSDLLTFAEKGHLKDASIFLGMTEDELKASNPALEYDDWFFEGIPAFFNNTYAYLTVDKKIFNMRYNALSEGPAIPYEQLTCQFGDPDEVFLNELRGEYYHVYHTGGNMISFISTEEKGSISAVELESQTDMLQEYKDSH
ncbi:hypothetical protein [Guptibacillus algicola]|uniref:hypothetical protein n=1 Tax=Guptibacillus algicola TaxID=225844 RepID=UPI001CD5162C|nr:hypothetical protein [Alkalihalobacillus algicola]MCA0987552.1 hypothetical protein [Alkalihalobacillus algicola]